jgi:hypothetical protein
MPGGARPDRAGNEGHGKAVAGRGAGLARRGRQVLGEAGLGSLGMIGRGKV